MATLSLMCGSMMSGTSSTTENVLNLPDLEKLGRDYPSFGAKFDGEGFTELLNRVVGKDVWRTGAMDQGKNLTDLTLEASSDNNVMVIQEESHLTRSQGKELFRRGFLDFKNGASSRQISNEEVKGVDRGGKGEAMQQKPPAPKALMGDGPLLLEGLPQLNTVLAKNHSDVGVGSMILKPLKGADEISSEVFQRRICTPPPLKGMRLDNDDGVNSAVVENGCDKTCLAMGTSDAMNPSAGGHPITSPSQAQVITALDAVVHEMQTSTVSIVAGGTTSHQVSPTVSQSPPPTFADVLQGRYTETAPLRKTHQERLQLDFTPPEMVEGTLEVRPPLHVVVKGCPRWKHTLVGYFLGRKPYFPSVEKHFRSLWTHLVEVRSTSNGFFKFRFESAEAMGEVLEGGPWSLNGQPLTLEEWRQGMTFEKKTHHEVPIWVRLRHLPSEYWTKDGLGIVASAVGRPLFPDAFTTTMERIDYARVYVLKNLNEPYIDSFNLRLPVKNRDQVDVINIKVEYEWRPSWCSICSGIGHNNSECPTKIKSKEQTALPTVISRTQPFSRTISQATSMHIVKDKRSWKRVVAKGKAIAVDTTSRDVRVANASRNLPPSSGLSDDPSSSRVHEVQGKIDEGRDEGMDQRNSKATEPSSAVNLMQSRLATTGSHLVKSNNSFAVLQDMPGDDIGS